MSEVGAEEEEVGGLTRLGVLRLKEVEVVVVAVGA